MPHLAPSIVRWLPDGRWQQLKPFDEWGLEPDKSAYLGDAYLRLYAATGNRKYLEAGKLPRRGAASRQKGWHYDPTTQLLRISHAGNKVEILMLGCINGKLFLVSKKVRIAA